MGNLNTILNGLSGTLGTIATLEGQIGSLTGIGTNGQKKALSAQQDLAMQSLQQQQALDESQSASEASRTRAQIALEAQQETDRRNKALKRAMAKQNAAYGAAGVSRSGSGEAVLLGLVNDTADDAGNATALDQLRYNTINSDLYDMQQQNVLERTQLAERQRLEKAIQGY